jgi:hypothetical protein
MSISIFYSWQSETPENRSFIKNALEKALKNIYKDKSYDLNERLELDHDTKDIP